MGKIFFSTVALGILLFCSTTCWATDRVLILVHDLPKKAGYQSAPVAERLKALLSLSSHEQNAASKIQLVTEARELGSFGFSFLIAVPSDRLGDVVRIIQTQKAVEVELLSEVLHAEGSGTLSQEISFLSRLSVYDAHVLFMDLKYLLSEPSISNLSSEQRALLKKRVVEIGTYLDRKGTIEARHYVLNQFEAAPELVGPIFLTTAAQRSKYFQAWLMMAEHMTENTLAYLSAPDHKRQLAWHGLSLGEGGRLRSGVLAVEHESHWENSYIHMLLQSRHLGMQELLKRASASERKAYEDQLIQLAWSGQLRFVAAIGDYWDLETKRIYEETMLPELQKDPSSNETSKKDAVQRARKAARVKVEQIQGLVTLDLVHRLLGSKDGVPCVRYLLGDDIK